MRLSFLSYFLQFIKSLLLLSFVFSLSRFYDYPMGDGESLSLMGSIGFSVFAMLVMTTLYTVPALIGAWLYGRFYQQRLVAAVLSFVGFGVFHLLVVRHLSEEFHALDTQFSLLFWLMFLIVVALTEFFIWRIERKSTAGDENVNS